MKLISLPLRRSLLFFGLFLPALLGGLPTVHGQILRFESHREVAVPDYATIKLGPFYSSVVFSQRAGYRYTTSDGAGTDFLIDNSRGTIREEGSEFPMVSSLDFRNYLVISPHMDLDVSVGMSYYHYPLDTQDDEFDIDMVDEGAYGNISMALNLTPYLRGTLYERFKFQTDYVDLRGMVDEYGGEKYRYFNNELGANLDWLMADDQSLGIDLVHEYNYPFDGEFADQEYSALNESLTYQQRVSAFASVGATAGYRQTFYTLETRPDSASQSYFGFTDVQLTERTKLHASLGFAIGTTSDTDDAVAEDETSTPIGSLVLTTEMSERARQELGASKSLPDGYTSAFEADGRFWYDYQWRGELNRFGFRSEFLNADPSGDLANAYTDWRNRVEFGHMVMKEVEVTLSSEYTLRGNDPPPLEDASDPTLADDYETWITRLGTSFPVSKRIVFTSYIEHAERFSDNEQLAFTRDTFEAYFTYRYEF